MLKLPSDCPNCRRKLMTTAGADTVNRVVWIICVHCGHQFGKLSDREVEAQQGPLWSRPMLITKALIDECQPKTNQEKRKEAAQKLISQSVRVYKLGEVKPESDPDIQFYLPLPEYGIALVAFDYRGS